MTNACSICEKEFVVKAGTTGKYCSISCSNRGRNGSVRKGYVTNYDKSPDSCRECSAALTYDQSQTGNKFCSRGCAAAFHNPNSVIRLMVVGHCKNCETEVDRRNVYCSRACQTEYHNDEELMPKVLAGEIHRRGTLRRILLKRRSNQCENCGITEWNKLPTPIELHHMDGDAGNNLAANLQLLCPNCHAQTDTMHGRNKGKGRGSRGLSLC